MRITGSTVFRILDTQYIRLFFEDGRVMTVEADKLINKEEK